MFNYQKPQEPRRSRIYVSPRLFAIGDACKVILGVAGGGEDFMGYSRPDFEFQPDPIVAEREPLAEERDKRL